MDVRVVLRFDRFDAEPNIDVEARTDWGDGVKVLQASKYMVALEGPAEAIESIHAQLGSHWSATPWSDARFELAGNPYANVDFHAEASPQTRAHVAAARAYWPSAPPPDGPASYTFLFQPRRPIQAKDIWPMVLGDGRIVSLDRRMAVMTGMRYTLLAIAYELGGDWVWYETPTQPISGPELGHPVPFPEELVAVTLPPSPDGSPSSLPDVAAQEPGDVTVALRYRPSGPVPDGVWGVIEAFAKVKVMERSIRMAVIQTQQVQVDAILRTLGEDWSAIPVDPASVCSTPTPPGLHRVVGTGDATQD